MTKLFVQHGKGGRTHPPFHPTLKIDPYSKFCKNQWQEMHFRPNCFVGAECVANTSVAEAIAIYFSELKRMNYQVASQLD